MFNRHVSECLQNNDDLISYMDASITNYQNGHTKLI